MGRIVATALAGLLVAACADWSAPATFRQGGRCASNGGCPPGQTCATDGRCLVACASGGTCQDDPWSPGRSLVCSYDQGCRFTCDPHAGISGCPSELTCDSAGTCRAMCGNSGGRCAANAWCDGTFCHLTCETTPCPVGATCVLNTAGGPKYCQPQAASADGGTVDAPVTGPGDGGLGDGPAGGPCDGGACLAQRLVRGSVNAQAIGLDDVAVYWADPSSGAIYRCPKSGCAAPEVVAQSVGGVSDLAVDPARHDVYWWQGQGNSVEMRMCPTTGCIGSPSPVASGLSVHAFALDPSALYLSVYGGGTGFEVCALPGCTGQTDFAPASVGAPRGMATDGTSVYWTACGGGFSGVLRCPNSGCTATPEQLAGATTCPQGPIVVYGSDVVWLDNGAVKRCATGGCGGTATTVATAPALMGSTAAMELLAVAAHGVYWLSAGNLVGCSYPSCTGEPVTYATGVCPVVAADDTAVYYVRSDGVYRLQP